MTQLGVGTSRDHAKRPEIQRNSLVVAPGRPQGRGCDFLLPGSDGVKRASVSQRPDSAAGPPSPGLLTDSRERSQSVQPGPSLGMYLNHR